jgi:hypothetical protein
MWTFILAGGLYLVGVAVILVIKPSFMFTPDGNWKEFGIGQSELRYTTFPFWLFCIVWAVISYTIVILLMPPMHPMHLTGEEDRFYEAPVKNQRKGRNSWFRNAPATASARVVPPVDDSDLVFDDEIEAPEMLKKGYYVLNKKASKLAGVPKYVYLGEDEP